MPFAAVAGIVETGEAVADPRLWYGEGRVAGDTDGELAVELLSKGVANGVALSDGVDETDGTTIGSDSIGEDSAGGDSIAGDAIGVDEAGETEEVAITADSVQAPPGGRSAQQP